MIEPTVDLVEGYRLLREEAAVIEVARDLVLVRGPDAASYLQGQLSQDVEALAPHAAALTLLLSPQGKVDAWCRLTRLGQQAYALDVEAGWGATVVDRLRRFLLRVDVELALLPGPAEQVGIGARGPGWRGVTLTGDAVLLEAPVLWPGLAGTDLLAAGRATPARDVPVAPLAAWEAVRIEAGLPVMGAELTEATIPEEVGVVESSASFTKGCYVGQELVARVDSRGGNVPRRLRGVVVEGDDVPDAGSEVVVEGEVVGALTSSARSPRLGVVALASIARRVDPTAGPVAAAVGGREARIEVLPLA